MCVTARSGNNRYRIIRSGCYGTYRDRRGRICIYVKIEGFRGGGRDVLPLTTTIGTGSVTARLHTKGFFCLRGGRKLNGHVKDGILSNGQRTSFKNQAVSI